MATPADSNGSDPLDAVVAEYLQKVEAGTPPDRDALVAAHPELADRLRAFFADLDRMGTHSESFRLPEIKLPEDFGDYEFLEEIGRGGMGVVYRVRQKSLNRVVALKMILSGPLADADALRRFRDEAETVSRLDHPHVVPVYEIGEHRGLPYFTMKLIEGQSLTKCLDKYANDPKAAAEILVKVCDAVHHAHQRGVLHRDLKPGNILLDVRGEPSVTDFGLARRVEEARTLTQSSAILGTPEYMAPEQAAGANDPTVAADVYGLGAILYALCTAEPPFRAPALYETIRRVVEELPVPPRKLRGGVPPDLETICLKCLEKDPAKRYASADAVAADLGRWLRGEPIAARPAGPLLRLTKWVRRRPTAAALAAVSIVSAVMLLGGGIYSAERINRQNRDLSDQAGELTTALGEVRKNEQALTNKQAELEENAKQLRRTVTDLRRNEYTLELEQYRGRLVEAQRELAAGNKQKARQILDGCQWDLRNWEFDYLAECCENKPAVVLVGDEVEAPRADPKTREWPKETRSLAFTPDGKQLVTTVRGRLTVFDTATGKAVRTIDEQRTWDAFALSPDGKSLACYDASTAGVVLMEFETGRSRAGVGTGTVRGSAIGSPMDTFAKKGLAFSPDGQRLLVGCTVFNVATGGSGVVLAYKLNGATSRHDGWHEVAPFSPDGKLVGLSFNPVNLEEKNQAAVWDAETGEVRAWLPGSPQGFRFLTFSPAGDRIAVGGYRNAVEVFHPTSGARLFACEAAQVNCVTFTRDGRRLLTGDATGAIRIWDAYLGKEIFSLPPIPNGRAVGALAVSADGSKLAAIVGTGDGGHRVHIWRGSESPGPGLLSRAEERDLRNREFQFGGGGDRIVALPHAPGFDDAVGAVFDAKSGRVLFQLRGSHGGLVHPTERRVVLANRKTIDLDTGATIAEWPVGSGPVGRGDVFAFESYRATITADGKHLADQGNRLYELSTGRCVAEYTFPNDYRSKEPFVQYPYRKRVLVHHPDGKRVFVLENDAEQSSYAIRALKMSLPEPQEEKPDGAERKPPAGRLESVMRFVGHTAPVQCQAVSRDGRFLASGGDDRTVRIWDAESGKQLQVLRGRPWSVRHLEFSPDGSYLLVAPDEPDRTAELWRVGQWEQPLTLDCPAGVAFAFTADGRTVRILAKHAPWCFEWDVQTGKPTRPQRDLSFLK